MLIDINGFNTLPNTSGKDVFNFILDDSGTVIPQGSKTHSWLIGTMANGLNMYWDSENENIRCNSKGVKNGYTCSGSIFDNNLKINIKLY